MAGPRGTGEQAVTAEEYAHGILRLIGDMPGQHGRLRCARIIGGYQVSVIDDVMGARLDQYSVTHGVTDDLTWPLREVVELVDAMFDGGLLTRTLGQRPTVVLTRAGFRALEALEASA